jgi:Outer membrane protein beta-barrel domain
MLDEMTACEKPCTAVQGADMRIRVQRLVVGLVASAALLAVSTPARAQGVGIGVKAGPLFSSFHDSTDSITFQKRTGLMGGLFIGGNRSGRVGIATELNVLKRTAKVDDGTILDFYSFQVPVFARINFGSSNTNGANFYALVGPAIDVRFKAQASLGGITQDVKDETESYDASIIGALGFEYARFIVEGRYTQGFRNLSKNLTDTVDIKTKTFALLFGVRFN